MIVNTDFMLLSSEESCCEYSYFGQTRITHNIRGAILLGLILIVGLKGAREKGSDMKMENVKMDVWPFKKGMI